MLGRDDRAVARVRAQIGHVHRPLVEGGVARQALAQAHPLAADRHVEPAGGGGLEHLGVRVVQQHPGGLDLEVGLHLLEEDVERQADVDRVRDRHVDAPQRLQVLQPALELRVEVGDLVRRAHPLGDVVVVQDVRTDRGVVDQVGDRALEPVPPPLGVTGAVRDPLALAGPVAQALDGVGAGGERRGVQHQLVALVDLERRRAERLAGLVGGAHLAAAVALDARVGVEDLRNAQVFEVADAEAVGVLVLQVERLQDAVRDRGEVGVRRSSARLTGAVNRCRCFERGKYGRNARIRPIAPHQPTCQPTRRPSPKPIAPASRLAIGCHGSRWPLCASRKPSPTSRKPTCSRMKTPTITESRWTPPDATASCNFTRALPGLKRGIARAEAAGEQRGPPPGRAPRTGRRRGGTGRPRGRSASNRATPAAPVP